MLWTDYVTLTLLIWMWVSLVIINRQQQTIKQQRSDIHLLLTTISAQGGHCTGDENDTRQNDGRD